jgi:hypothetical protein
MKNLASRSIKILVIGFLTLVGMFGCSPGQSEKIPEPSLGVPTEPAVEEPAPTERLEEEGTVQNEATPLESPAGSATAQPEDTVTPSAQPLPTEATPTEAEPTSISPADWKSWPVVPQVTDTALAIYQRGLQRGRDPRAFAKMGDCQNVPSMFLSVFDQPGYYSLGEEYAYLAETIAWYSDSFSRESEAVRRGFNAASVVSPLWADPEACDPGETPLDCEIRLHNPSIAIISLETWWEGDPDAYERYVRQIIENTIDQDVVPILATKGDNLEGDHRINTTLVRLAAEYDIPLWNFWRAIQPLPNHGLREDGFHLTFAGNYFDDPEKMQAAWPWRNLTALQTLDSVWKGLGESEPD